MKGFQCFGLRPNYQLSIELLHAQWVLLVGALGLGVQGVGALRHWIVVVLTLCMGCLEMKAAEGRAVKQLVCAEVPLHLQFVVGVLGMLLGLG